MWIQYQAEPAEMQNKEWTVVSAREGLAWQAAAPLCVPNATKIKLSEPQLCGSVIALACAPSKPIPIFGVVLKQATC
jgi:hypothetical protein